MSTCFAKENKVLSVFKGVSDIWSDTKRALIL